jgi:hypothetical protein
MTAIWPLNHQVWISTALNVNYFDLLSIPGMKWMRYGDKWGRMFY